MSLITIPVASGVSCIQETGVANVMRCNIWHVRGRDCDLVIDTGMGLNPLKKYIAQSTDKPLKAIATHSHFDHSGSLHEFDCRLGHRLEAEAFAAGGREAVLFQGAWTEIDFICPQRHGDFDRQTFTITPAPLTGYIDEGDVIDLGDRAFQVLHLPGHSPGSIGLYDLKSATLFSGDAVYDGALLDSHPHSDKQIYRQTLQRLQRLGAEVIHAGHSPSFGGEKLDAIVESYFSGQNVMPDVKEWFAEFQADENDPYANQDWPESGC